MNSKKKPKLVDSLDTRRIKSNFLSLIDYRIISDELTKGFAEAGFPGIDVPIWYAIWAPAATPKPIIDALNAKVREIAATPDMLARMQAINVVVPLAALSGAGDAGAAGADAGMLGGEPVDGDVIRDLVADASSGTTLRRLVTDSKGCIVDAGRTRYAISDTQRHLIALRDRTCRFPGCTRPAVKCEIDHATAYDDGGHTDLCNLGPLCKHHHQLKTHGGWRITRSERNGACTWRSPLGRIYQHDPPDLLPPEPPPQLSAAVHVEMGPMPF